MRAIAYAAESSGRFATASVDRTVRVWDANDYKCSATVRVRDAGERARPVSKSERCLSRVCFFFIQRMRHKWYILKKRQQLRERERERERKSDPSPFAPVSRRPTCVVYTLDFLTTGWTDGKIRAHDSDTSKPLW